MAGDWIKMRTSLLTNPKVNGIAKELESCRLVGKALSTGFSGPLQEIVTRNVTRHVTVSSLLVVWGAANEHTRDGVFLNSDLADIDDMTGIPGFGNAMASVGWAEYDAENNSVTLPNFNEYNTSGVERSATAKTAAQRQKEYRERKALQNSDVTRDVTNDVTRNRREEKRREENKDQKPSSSAAQTTGKGDLDAKAFKERRLIEITDDAIEVFNRILGKPVGMLPAVHATVGKDKRRKQVGRALKVICDICIDQYDDPHITKKFWEDYFAECDLDPFKSGRQLPGKGHENWTPSFEYLTREAVVIEVFDKANSQEKAA